MRKLLLFIAFIALNIAAIHAVPAKPGILTHSQADGSVVEFRIHGDEYFNFTTTPDGYLITRSDDGYFEYAQMQDFKVQSTGVRVNNVSLRAAEEIELISKVGRFSMEPAQIGMARNARKQARGVKRPMQGASNVATNGLVVLVNFKDKAFITSNPNQSFSNLLNQEGYSSQGALGSARDYFNEMSEDTYNPTFDVYGPYTIDQNMNFYGENDRSGNDKEPAQMVVDAMAKLMADGSANINLSDYDTDNDGVLDNIFIFYAGHNEAEGAAENTVWPHAWAVGSWNASGTFSYQGKEIYGYACSSELNGDSGSNMAGINTFCHEFSHVLGLPDLYATDYATHKTSGDWDLMDGGSYNNGGHTPPSFSAYEKFFMGWLTPTILNSAGKYTLENIIDKNEAYLISSTGEHNLVGDNPNSSTFYLLENRVKERWDEYLPGEGMIITKIKYSKSLWENNTVNTGEANMGIDIIEADGKRPTSGDGYNGKAGDAFPGSSKVMSFSPYSQYPITGIRFANDVISFDFMGGVAQYSVSFSAGSYGQCSVDMLTEETENGGIILPEVTANADSITFIGWSVSSNGESADAGTAGEKYQPSADISLYAIYSINGEIVGVGDITDCFSESFDKLVGENAGTDLSSKIDEWTDNIGWSGVKIFVHDGAVKIGSNKHKGSITTPALDMSGDVELKLSAMGKDPANLNITTSNGGSYSVAVGDIFNDYSVIIPDWIVGSSISINADINVFYIDDITICKAQCTGVGGTSDDLVELMILDNKTLMGVDSGDVVRCIDMSGRTLWSRTAENDKMNFSAPMGVYCIVVEHNGHLFSIKGINL